MSSRHTWFWLILALGLLGFIFLVQRRQPRTVAAPSRILPELKASEVGVIQVRPATRPLGIRAERTNDGWQLTQPIAYPAQSTNIDAFVGTLQNLAPATFITPAQLRGHRNPEEEYGFATPQASIVIQQGDYRATVLVGALTTPGDQVFLQVVGREGVYVTDAAWLTSIPKSADDWRDTSVLPPDLNRLDRVAVTNNSRIFVLERESNGLWRMIWPLSSARADNARIHEALGKLERLKIRNFISDDPKADFESFGLAPPALELSLGQGTNSATVFELGKTVPTATNQVYARRLGSPTVFTVEYEPLLPWRTASVNEFRDPHLLTPPLPIGTIEVRGDERFSIVGETNRAWRLEPQEFPVDAGLVQDFIGALTGLKIVQFVKDVVNAPDLPQFGLASPVRRYSIKSTVGSSPASATNCLMAELNFGTTTNQPEKVFVWRPDESAVYAISTNDFARLPSWSWQLRERKLWKFSIEDVTGVRITQQGRTREIIRNAAHSWSLAPGSQGLIEDLAVEETMRGLVQAAAVAWVARGEEAQKGWGLPDTAYQVTINLKNGEKATLQFGAEAPSTNRYAGVLLDGQLWVFEFPWPLFRQVSTYLVAP